MIPATAIRSSRRMPDFAGVALVDILANGVAMLIIVIVVTIAARMEREERFSEQADEVATVMSHKFSTSLVLNSLAASPPARLHDYETSPLDQVLDPDVLPILELHREFVREFYTGTTWTRRELLEERSRLGAWLSEFSAERKARLRVDVYDIPQFYLTMSILREHGIRVFHWHFIPAMLSPADAARCPPGVAAKDCAGGGGDVPAPLPQLARDDRGSGGLGGLGGLDTLLHAPPGGEERGSGGAGDPRELAPQSEGSSPRPMPGGVVPGMTGQTGARFGGQGGGSGSRGAGSGSEGGFAESGDAGRGEADGDSRAAGASRGLLTEPGSGAGSHGFGTDPGAESGSAATLGSFPGARVGRGEPSAGAGHGHAPRSGEGRSGSGPGGDGPQFSLRIALPESLRREAQSGSQGTAALEAMFGIILHYLGELQGTLDAGGTPSPQIDGFAERIQTAFRAPPPIDEAERQIARDLALKFALLPHLGSPGFRPEPLLLRPDPPGANPEAALVVAPNRLNDVVGVYRGADETDEREPAATLAGRGFANLALNAYPGIWKGLKIKIEPYSVLLMPPGVTEPERTRWRAVAYITPRLDDFIVGFLFADMDAQGWLRIQADANRVRLEGRALFTRYLESTFGARGWLVALYAALAAGLLLLGAGWRHLAVRTA